MDKQINGWTVLLILAMLAMGYAFGIWQTRTLIPAASAQIAANKEVVTNVNASFQNLVKQVNVAFEGMEKRVKTLEAKRPGG